ncbi:MAG TPA: FG-GAP-like repeat-containing protein, partial [Candidatus Udaeobacter sp.]|nr:FG-GAP-like repeat-containing protein [Candidatus Udaeobacter sp.]
GWELVTSADFDLNGYPDYALFNRGTGQTAIWYLNNNVYARGAYGPTLPSGWELVTSADFDLNGYPDYALFNRGTGQTAIWYLNNNVYVRGAYGPTLP